METEFFGGLKIDDCQFLEEIDGRAVCCKCQKSRKYFCYICSVPTIGEESIPNLKLPLKIDILKHQKEYHGKSTSCHAAIIAPDDVTIYKYPVIPDYDLDSTLLLYPADNAKSMLEWLSDSKDVQFINSPSADDDNKGDAQNFPKRKHHDSPTSAEPNYPNKSQKRLPWFTKLVLIDSTWNQAPTMFHDPRLKNLKCLALKNYESKFWRYQRDNPSHYLCTIETIYYSLVEYHEATEMGAYDGRYDNILFYFKFLYDKLYAIYDGGKDLKAYNKKNFNPPS